MLNEIQQEWVRRLRSGEIKQVKGRLGDTEGGRCYLGVLCDMAVEAKIISQPDIVHGILGKPILSYSGARGRLPIAVCEWSGMRNIRGFVAMKVMERDSLVGYNDLDTSFP